MNEHFADKYNLVASKAVDLSIVIVNWNTSALLQACLKSIVETISSDRIEIIVVDNASIDTSIEATRRDFPHVVLIENKSNVGFARANNQGIHASVGRYTLLLNSDTLMQPDTLGGLIRFMDSHLDVGACSPRLVTTKGEPQPFAFGEDPTLLYLMRRAFNKIIFNRSLHNWNVDHTLDVGFVAGTCLMLRRAALEQIGALDENIFMYFEDNDLCLRLRKNRWRVCYVPSLTVMHLGGQSVKNNPQARFAYQDGLRYFYRKHYTKVEQLVLSWILPLYTKHMMKPNNTRQ
jgi:hypothetical protein